SDRVMCVHLAAWQLGAVTVPLSVLYGRDGLAYRLADADPTVVVAESDKFDAVTKALSGVDTVELFAGTDAEPPALKGATTAAMDELTEGRRPQFEARATAPTDPAFILYTSGTTGRPKGVVQDHQTLLGWLPGFQMCFELPWHDADPFLYATPPLAWIGGINLVLGAWHYGFPVLVNDAVGGFDPVTVFENLDRYGPTRAVLVPGMLKAMQQVDAAAYDLSSLTVVMSGSEPVSAALHEYVVETLGANLNEMYGQTEALHIVSSCSQWHDADPGSLGYPVPGHEVAIIDESGDRVSDDEVGIIGLEEPDPAMFAELWQDPEATAEKFIDGWMNTDDLGYRAEDGQFWFKSRADNLIITRGYRVGPAEVEDSIIQLDAVEDVAVVGVEGDDGGQIVKAYIVLEGGVSRTAELKDRIRSHVKSNLAAYQYPREIEFLDALPKTVTGKIQRHKLQDG
ncbi:MAG: acyl-CoA synthetase, partial [Halobacteriales archaeon]